MSFIKSHHFYKAYFLEYWSHKLSLINHSFHNLEEIYPKIEEGLPTSTEDLFKSYLKIEIHSTYYSLVETLFTLVYLLNTGNEKELWCRLGKANNAIFSNLKSIAEPLSDGDFHFLEKRKTIESGKSVQFLDFLFFRGIEINNEEIKTRSHENIKKLFSGMAQDYLNRGSHNAIKHSMHALKQKFSISFDESVPEMGEDVVFEDSILYINEALDDRKIRINVKKTDFEKDYNRANAAFCLISNLIKTREWLFFGLDKFELYPFIESDLEPAISWKDDPQFKSLGIEYFESEFCK